MEDPGSRHLYCEGLRPKDPSGSATLITGNPQTPVCNESLSAQAAGVINMLTRQAFSATATTSDDGDVCGGSKNRQPPRRLHGFPRHGCYTGDDTNTT